MITQDVSFEGFTATDWQRLADVFRAPGQAVSEQERGRTRTRGGVVAITTGNRLRKLVHTQRGRLDVQSADWPMKLPALAGRYDSSWAAELSAGALEELVERFSERIRPQQVYLEQALELLRALRELEAEGLVAMWPKRFSEIPMPGSRVIGSAFDLLCGDGRALCLGVFRHGELYTGLVARRRGSASIKSSGPTSCAPRWVCCPETFGATIATSPRPRSATWRRSRSACSVSCSPFSRSPRIRRPARSRWPSLRAICCSRRRARGSRCRSASTWVVRRSPGLAQRLGAGEALGPMLGRAEEFVSRDLAGLLGFDPWAALVGLFERDRDQRERD